VRPTTVSGSANARASATSFSFSLIMSSYRKPVVCVVQVRVVYERLYSG